MDGRPAGSCKTNRVVSTDVATRSRVATKLPRCFDLPRATQAGSGASNHGLAGVPCRSRSVYGWDAGEAGQYLVSEYSHLPLTGAGEDQAEADPSTAACSAAVACGELLDDARRCPECFVSGRIPFSPVQPGDTRKLDEHHAEGAAPVRRPLRLGWAISWKWRRV